jgi:hypothetical protein
MMEDAIPSMLTYGACVIVAVLAYQYMKKRCVPSNRRLPPGPARLPLFGNMFDLPQEEAWLTYDQWSKQYGTRQQILAQSSLNAHIPQETSSM